MRPDDDWVPFRYRRSRLPCRGAFAARASLVVCFTVRVLWIGLREARPRALLTNALECYGPHLRHIERSGLSSGDGLVVAAGRIRQLVSRLAGSWPTTWPTGSRCSVPPTAEGQVEYG